MIQKISLFLLSSIFFGSLVFFIFGPFIVDSSLTNFSLICGLIFGTVMTVLILFIQRYYLRKVGLKKSGISVVNSIKFEAAGNKEQIFELCLRSFATIKKCKVKQMNRDKGIITVEAGRTWLTWEDHIQFDIKEIEQNLCTVEATSRPALVTTLIDYGKNLDNIVKIFTYFKANTMIKVIQNGCNIT